MTIGEVSHRAGVPSSTIRYYERIGLLPSPPRSGGQRRYSGDVVLSRLAVVALAQSCGFRLEEVRQLLHGFRPEAPPSERWRRFAAAKRVELTAKMKELRSMQGLLERVAECQCVDLNECGRRALSAYRRIARPIE
jgi:MerR family redox-sensitive transcriptional activator SoxR